MKKTPEQLLNLAWSSRNFNAVYVLVLFALLLLPLSRFVPERAKRSALRSWTVWLMRIPRLKRGWNFRRITR